MMSHVTPNGAAIRAIRTAQHSSLRHVAERAGINPSYLGQIEREERQPRAQTIHRIAHALGVQLAAITCQHNERESP